MHWCIATWQAWLDEQLHQGEMEEVGQTLAAASVQLPTGGDAPMEPTPEKVVEAETVRRSPTGDGAPPRAGFDELDFAAIQVHAQELAAARGISLDDAPAPGAPMPPAAQIVRHAIDLARQDAAGSSSQRSRRPGQ